MLNRGNFFRHFPVVAELPDHVVEVRHLGEVPELGLHVDQQLGRHHVYEGAARQLPHGLALLVAAGQVIEHLVRQLVDLVDNLHNDHKVEVTFRAPSKATI